jgi:hypothetical protein
MKMTLLELTQDVLSSMSSDEVNSIGDTTESLQVATIIKNKYFDIVSRISLPEHEQLIQLNPSLDADSPVLMYVPDGVTSIKWIKYFNSDAVDTSTAAPGYQYVTMLPIQQFIEMVNTFNPDENNVDSFDFTESARPGSYTFYYKTDRQPTFCCVLSNFYVIFDAYDNTLDSTLQASKTMAWGQIIPTFTMEDSFIPNLEEAQFPLLLNEAKAMAYFELKQTAHPKAEQEIKRGWSTVQKNKSIADKPSYFEALPNFGRRGSWSNSSSSYFKSRGWDSVNG